MGVSPQNSIMISPRLSVGDWRTKRLHLIKDINNGENSAELWEEVFDYFQERIDTRFLHPINWIISKHKEKGEGFSAVALQCILIEFLESFYQGKVYTTARELGPFEYNSSRSLFIDFLMKHDPFSHIFQSRTLAGNFFDCVRCGLLHEAATKKNWLIRKNILEDVFYENDGVYNIIYRENFFEAIKKYIDHYRTELYANRNLKINFIRKFDDIAQIMRVIYFAYGSNMDKKQLIGRIGKYHTSSKAILDNFKFTYNKLSVDGSAKANIIEDKSFMVLGICYEIDKSDLIELKRYEKGYDQINIKINFGEKDNFEAVTFKSNSISNDIKPSKAYRSIILKAANSWGLPKDYIEHNL